MQLFEHGKDYGTQQDIDAVKLPLLCDWRCPPVYRNPVCCLYRCPLLFVLLFVYFECKNIKNIIQKYVARLAKDFFASPASVHAENKPLKSYLWQLSTKNKLKNNKQTIALFCVENFLLPLHPQNG